MSGKNVKEHALLPEMKQVYEYWDKSGIDSCNLSSAGIVIGAQYAQKITSQNYDLNIWI